MEWLPCLEAFLYLLRYLNNTSLTPGRLSGLVLPRPDCACARPHEEHHHQPFGDRRPHGELEGGGSSGHEARHEPHDAAQGVVEQRKAPSATRQGKTSHSLYACHLLPLYFHSASSVHGLRTCTLPYTSAPSA